MKKEKFVIGVLGGMGTYATVHLFKEYADIFEAVKEWDRPRIIIDNRCTMPSRVRAFLYQENVEKLITEMSESISNMIKAGCKRIVLACNTSHLFLPLIYEILPETPRVVVNIIDVCVSELAEKKISKVYLLASEGTIDSEIYQKKLAEAGIVCEVPGRDTYEMLRTCIEAVKQNEYSDEVCTVFQSLLNGQKNCILGCTELPVLYEKYKTFINCDAVYDPLLMTIRKLKEEYDQCEK